MTSTSMISCRCVSDALSFHLSSLNLFSFLSRLGCLYNNFVLIIHFPSHISSLTIQELAQYQVFITLFLGLLIRVNALPGSIWTNVLDALLTITNSSTSIASLFFVFRTQQPWKHKSLMSLESLPLFVAQLWASCSRRERGRGRHGESVQADAPTALNRPVDAKVIPSPATIFRLHQQPSPLSPSAAKVHIGPSSEKSPSINLSPSALPTSTSPQVESQESLLPALAANREEESQLDVNHAAPVHNPLPSPGAHMAASLIVHHDISRQQEQKERPS